LHNLQNWLKTPILAGLTHKLATVNWAVNASMNSNDNYARASNPSLEQQPASPSVAAHSGHAVDF
jgi:hypothetical protein